MNVAFVGLIISSIVMLITVIAFFRSWKKDRDTKDARNLASEKVKLEKEITLNNDIREIKDNLGIYTCDIKEIKEIVNSHDTKINSHEIRIKCIEDRYSFGNYSKKHDRES